MLDTATTMPTTAFPGHLKVAFTTNSLLSVDADFGTARQFVFYEVSAEATAFVDCVQFKDRPRGGGEGGGGEKKGGGRCCGGAPAPAVGSSIDARIEALRGTGLLFTLAMSDPQSVRVADLGVFPVKLAGARSILEAVDRLQEMLRGTPPLWLQRAMRGSAALDAVA
ncbi:MAG: nitrogen fixation protein [Defluviicoccus sp.]|nr:nitrogen fixation protein [Defluviicoccus sp.]MDS4073761.1 nitrogen fixation protein [Defluviicoccus sp.]